MFVFLKALPAGLVPRQENVISFEEVFSGDVSLRDLRADRGDRALFVEVETGRSDIAANVAKYPDNVDLVVFFTNVEVAGRYRELVLLDRPSTRCLTPSEIEQLVM